MNRMRKRNWVGLAVLVAAAALPGCKFIGDLFGGDEKTKNEVTGVTVSPNPASVLLGGSRRFYVKASGAGSPAETVVWSVEGGGAGTAIDENTGELTVAEDEAVRTFTVRATSTADSNESCAVPVTVVEVVDSNALSIKEKFGITSGGTQGVADAFNAVDALIEAGGLSFQPVVIKLGDWIDLEGGLVVDAYNSVGAFSASNDDYGIYGKRLRIIVVGINSFDGKNGNNQQHVVFHFEHGPGGGYNFRRMEATNTNANGYLGSEMRKYLAPTEGDAESGRYLAGLMDAGVPQDVLWAPVRYVANKGLGATGADRVTDLLWLPTERELFGNNTYSHTAWETADNQARLEYYTDNASREKIGLYFGGTSGWGISYWELSYWYASPYASDSSSFCKTFNQIANERPAGDPLAVIPAFCVK